MWCRRRKCSARCRPSLNFFRLKHLLLKNCWGHGSHILCQLSPHSVLPSLFKSGHSGQKTGHQVHSNAKLWQSSSPKAQCLEVWYFTSSVALWSSTKFVHFRSSRSKTRPPGPFSWNPLKISSSQKVLCVLAWYFTSSIPHRSSTKFVQFRSIRSKTRSPGSLAWKSLEIFCYKSIMCSGLILYI